ncbi:MAG: hypothetical protein C0432_03550 [Candidatus Puniceispirillum sp.]|nr:hypothetical protein [Candidatus Pelagibacter sp.]MBA4283349.1 hypothetical protein [Candidatus Puniceispirillum sp.]
MFFLGCTPKNNFHKPITDVEKTLDQIIIQSSNEDNVLICILKNAKCINAYADFLNMFSSKLLNKIRGRENATVIQNCKGLDIPGMSCGIDYNPITGGQDSSDQYLYRTVQNSEDSKTIEMIFSDRANNNINRYRMVLKKGRWILDWIHLGIT